MPGLSSTNVMETIINNVIRYNLLFVELHWFNILLADPISQQLKEEELDQIYSNVYPVLFRLGILLGVDIHDIEAAVDDPSQDPWSKCRRVIQRWRLNVAPERER